MATPHTWTCGSIAIVNQQAYQLIMYLLSEDGKEIHWDAKALVRQVRAQEQWIHHEDSTSKYTIAPVNTSSITGLLVLLSYRPVPILPFCWPSARRAVRFVNAVVSLVTANAFISTLGGGHFLCKHLDQAKMMAKIQIAVSQGLHDPILESKCRVNLAYGAMQGGKFRRAYRIIQQEAEVAKELTSDELEKVCYAAKVYLMKTYRLHKEYLRNVSELGQKERLHDNFYRQRIVRTAK
uniref:Uncharacterized protein n=1 Tax=Globisporangium ultimum (strain ATCC 200006 / CBS 805.95 / DAOM BR144) TaxID=431595 RepID=K3X9G5_GLOUD